MDTDTCNVVYVDRSVREDRVVRLHPNGAGHLRGAGSDSDDQWESPSLRDNVGLLLEVFGQG